MTIKEERWKEKYSRLLDDYERLERSHNQRTGLLERGLVRSSIAAEGQDPRLDKQLQTLRDTMRAADNQKLQQVVDNIERYLLTTENQREQRQQTLMAALDSLSSQLLTVSQSSTTRQALKKLHKALKDSQQLNLDLHNWLFEFSQLQAEVLQQPFTGSNQPGLLNRLFGRSKSPITGPENPQATMAEPVAPTTVSELDIASDPDSNTRQTSNTVLEHAVCQNDFDALCQALLKLLDELPTSEQDAGLVHQLRQQLASCPDQHTLIQTLNQLTELVIRTSARHQQEFGHYLQELNSKLNLITHSVSQARDSYSTSIQSADNLDQNLHNQMNELHQDVQQTSDLNTLKQRVDQRLNQFMATLKQHQQQRKDSEGKLLQRLHELNERVHLVETEALQLTSQLMEQHEKARRDALTGLPNRAAWDERLQIEHQRLERQPLPLLLAVIDIDHFKRINDTYGHLAGDKVLKILANKLQQGIRKTDFVARYGGEEFVILLPDTRMDDGIVLLDKLREDIANCPFHFKGEPVQITFSAGIGQLQADDETSAVFARIDQALYAAKQDGRNRVKSAAASAP